MERVTVHFHGGTTAVAHVDHNDIELENERLADDPRVNFTPELRVTNTEELVESAITQPPRPRWLWIGDLYCFSQAVCGFECSTGEEV
jgi:hypothetical protein